MATLDWVHWFNHKRLLRQSGTSRQRKSVRLTIGNRLRCPRRRGSNQIVSAKPRGAVSPSLTSSATDAVVDEVKTWQARTLDPVYPIVCLDAPDPSSSTLKKQGSGGGSVTALQEFVPIITSD